MTAQIVTAATNILMALEFSLFAALLFRRQSAIGSARWYWAWSLLLLGVAAVLGGIDHGLMESGEATGEITMLTRPTWLVLGLMTLTVLLTLARQYFHGRGFRVVVGLAAIQFAVFAACLPFVQTFLVVMVNYGAAIILLLVLNMMHLKSGKGSWQMVLGIAIMLLASAVQATGVDAFPLLDHNGLYHVIAMLGIPLLYLGGVRLGNPGISR